MAKRGPKPKEIDWTEFDKLCQLQCSLREIASWFDCSEDTIENRVKQVHSMKFSEYYEQKRGRGKIALRRKQYDVAMNGNVAMLIWLGKQYLGQAERQAVDITTKGAPVSFVPDDLKNKSDEEIFNEYKKLVGEGRRR